MFGTWIRQIQHDLHKHFPASKDLKPADFKREPMPVSVGHFLEHALSRRAAMVKVTVDQDWFDLNDPELETAQTRWREALRKSARYPAALWDKSVDQAVSHVVAFLVTPADAFAEFAVGGADDGVRPATVLNRLEYFRPYSALRAVIKGYVERRGSEPITKEDLRLAILKADRTIVATYEPSDWMALLHPLYELASVTVVGENEPQVPTSVLKPLFEAKDATEIVNRIEAIESIGGHKRLSETALLKALGPTEIVEPEPEREEVARPNAPVENGVPTETGPVQFNDMHSETADAVVPRWMQFATKVDPTPPDRTAGDGGPAVLHEQFGNPLRVGQRAPLPEDLDGASQVPDNLAADQPVDQTERRVLGDLNPVQRAWFVNHLFAGDYGTFSQVVGLLDRAEDWETASKVIAAQVFERHEVDIYSQPAIEFTNVVEARFQ